MIDANPMLIFINLNNKLYIIFNNYKFSAPDLSWYTNYINLLLYIIFKIRLNIAFAVFYLNYYIIRPGSAYIKTVKKVLYYLTNIFDLKFIYKEDL